ncbi:MAG TPA: alkaline phosphatase family protein, partial [Blastocatellia bacterium]
GGHNLWAGVERDGVSSHKGASQSSPGALLSIYRALDRSIDRLLGHASERTQVYVISDHGMGPHTGASYHLAEWLESRGHMVRVHSSQNRASLISAGRDMARSLLPFSIRERIKSGIGAERMKRLQVAEKDSFYSSIDWARTRAYTEPGRHVININLAGRNAQGFVPRAEYDKVCAQIIEDLRLWTDARGVRVVERVVRRDEVYFGPFQERASDLYVYWNPAADLREPPAEVRARGFWWSGDHRPEGVLICKGEGIRRGARLDPPAVYDLLPTLMYAAQLPVPENLDGKVIQQACADDFIARNPIRAGSSLQGQAPERGSLSETEERLIEEKLRGLGYL